MRKIEVRIILGILTVVVVGIATGCGASGGASNAITGGSSNAPAATLTVAFASATESLSDIVLAEQLGYFKAANLNVELEATGGNGASLALAGKVDLADFSPSAIFPAIASGRKVSLIWAENVYNVPASIMVLKNSPLHNLQGLSGKVLAAPSRGGSGWVDAEHNSSIVVANGGSPLTIEPYSEASGTVDALLSGRAQAAEATADYFAPQLTDGSVRYLVNAESLRNTEYGKSIVPGIWGLTAIIQQKKAALTRFILAMYKAAKYLRSHTPAQVAQVVANASVYVQGRYSRTNLVQSLTLDRWNTDTTLGCVPAAAWAGTLSNIKGTDPPLNGMSLSDAAFSYKSVVDMSFLKKAGGC